ncbi:YfjP family GTPase [Serinicoccus sp. LYQ131]|uniref:YfjP family GTPase n=1 Tax=Serinicoccus sp. LYQ131 TaxID=3378797 RepID=UPI0038526DD3
MTAPARRRGRRPELALTERAERLGSVLELSGNELEPAAVQSARAVVDRVGQRWAIGGGRTVVALAGATGSGKSSLFNALVGEDVSTISPRRPTTAEATAAVWGEEDDAELLDWLGVGRRHHVGAAGEHGGLDGLVLVDLPDVDSRELRHRVEADRILERADVFVWVTDPQKYADARLHEDYLRPLRHHDAVMLVVLNQVDRVREQGGVEQITADLRRLVQADGAGEHDVIGTSARMGTGLGELRQRIGAVVGARNATEARLEADLRAAAEELARGVAERTPALGQETDRRLHAALRVSAGVPVVLDAVDADHRRRAHARTGWPFTRWVAGLRADPLRRLRLGNDRAGSSGIAPSDVRAVLGRSSLPSPTPAARANVQLATRQLGEDVGEHLPTPWAESVLDAASPEQDTVSDALDQAVVGVPLRTRTPAWWPVLGVLQLLLATTAVVGLGWLTALAVLGWMQLSVEAPSLGPVPVPLALLVGGLLAGVLIAALGRVAARVGGRRRRAQVGRELDRAIEAVSAEHIRRPVAAVLERHEATRVLLQQAGSGAP